MTSGLYWKYNIWKKGRYLDLWSFTHLLSGVLLARISFFIETSFLLRFLIALAVMAAWELYEILKPIPEAINNRILDTILGISGFLVTYYVLMRVEFASATILLVIVFLLWLFFNLWGCIAWLKREKLI